MLGEASPPIPGAVSWSEPKTASLFGFDPLPDMPLPFWPSPLLAPPELPLAFQGAVALPISSVKPEP